MVEHLLAEAVLLHQTSLDEDKPPEYPIVVARDTGGLLCLPQEGRDLVLDPGTLPELFKLLRSLARGT